MKSHVAGNAYAVLRSDGWYDKNYKGKHYKLNYKATLNIYLYYNSSNNYSENVIINQNSIYRTIREHEYQHYLSYMNYWNNAVDMIPIFNNRYYCSKNCAEKMGVILKFIMAISKDYADIECYEFDIQEYGIYNADEYATLITRINKSEKDIQQKTDIIKKSVEEYNKMNCVDDTGIIKNIAYDDNYIVIPFNPNIL